MNATVNVSSVFYDLIERSKTHRFLILEGSSRSTKTFSALQYIIYRCLESKITVTISRLKLTWLKKTVLIDFLFILEHQFKQPVYRLHKTEMVYTFGNGSIVNFIGSEEEQKLHGLKQDIYYGNEYDEASYKQFEQANIRTKDLFIIDYNPKYVEHWIYERIEPRADAILLKSTYKDNPFLSQNIVNEIEALKECDEVSWQIYGLGLRTAYQGIIFPNWKIVPDVPKEYEWKAYGQDSGFNDPFTFTEVYFDGYNITVNEVIYESHLTDSDVIKKLEELNISKDDEIIGDSSDPALLTAQRLAGFNIRGANKFPGSILSGIKILKQYPVFVTKKSVNIIREKNMYRWKKHAQTEKFIDDPEDANNHTIDGIRYVVLHKGLLALLENRK
jgi:phage terminase large subunit